MSVCHRSRWVFIVYVGCPSRSVTCVLSSACLKPSQFACFKDSQGCIGIMIEIVESVKFTGRWSLDVTSLVMWWCKWALWDWAGAEWGKASTPSKAAPVLSEAITRWLWRPLQCIVDNSSYCTSLSHNNYESKHLFVQDIEYVDFLVLLSFPSSYYLSVIQTAITNNVLLYLLVI